jgi:hypothetical protein
VWGSWHTETSVHTNCGPYLAHTIQGDRRSSEVSALESAIPPDDHNQCVFIRYYTIRRRLFIPMVIKAGAGPHQLPKSDPRDDNTGEEGLQPSSDDDSTEDDYQDRITHNAFDEVIHNVPPVCPKCHHAYPYLRTGPRMTVMALILLQNSYFRWETSSYALGGTKEQTQFNRDPRRTRYYCTTRDIQDLLRVCLRTHPNPSLTLVQEDEEETIRCSLSLGWPSGSKLTKTEVNRSQFLHG